MVVVGLEALRISTSPVQLKVFQAVAARARASMTWMLTDRTTCPAIHRQVNVHARPAVVAPVQLNPVSISPGPGSRAAPGKRKRSLSKPPPRLVLELDTARRRVTGLGLVQVERIRSDVQRGSPIASAVGFPARESA